MLYLTQLIAIGDKNGNVTVCRALVQSLVMVALCHYNHNNFLSKLACLRVYPGVNEGV